MSSDQRKRLEWSLLGLRIGVFIVMFMWTIDKLIRVDHAKGVFANFYFLSGFADTIMYGLAVLEFVLILAFLFGIKKRLTYGLVLLLHGVSTLSSFKQYLNPFEGPNLLFFAAWPMLSACVALYLLRDSDQIFTVSQKASKGV